MNYVLTLILQVCLNLLKKNGEDVRLVYDNPKGSISFQGNLKYAKKFAVPRVKANG